MTAAPDRRQDLMEAGQRLFLATGYAATSIDTICLAAGVTKGAFFHHFKSKDDFASEILAYTWQPVLDAHHDRPTDEQPKDALERHIRFMIDWICESGRLMPMLAQELGSSNPQIRQQILGYFETWMGYLQDRLVAARMGSANRQDVEALKDFVVATTEGVPAVRGQFGDQVVKNVSDHLVTAVLESLGHRMD